MGKGKGKVRARNSRRELLKKKNDFFMRRKKVLSSIRKWDDKILTIPCEPVEEWEDVSAVIKEMKTVLKMSKSGVGLAASQLSHLKSIVALRPDISKGDIRILINPEIVDKSEEIREVKEMCLSFPGVVSVVERYVKVKVSYLDEDKKPKEEEFTGIESIIVQHEIEHLSGTCAVQKAWKKEQKIIEENSVKTSN